MKVIDDNDTNSSLGRSLATAPFIQAMKIEYNGLIKQINTPPSSRKHVKKSFVSFPQKLHLILKIAPKYDMNHIISWEIHGRCFHVHNREMFVDTILKNFFGGTKFASFQRQLSQYGFKTKNETDKGAYYHKKFIRGRFDLCKALLRLPIKGKRSTLRNSDYKDIEPNFYWMPYCMDDDNDLSIAIQATTSMGSVDHDTTNTHNVSTICHVSHDHHLRDDRYDLTDGPATTSVSVATGDLEEMSDTTQPLRVHCAPSLRVSPDEFMIRLHQHPHLNERANHVHFPFASGECRDGGGSNDESYSIQLPFVQHAPQLQKMYMSNQSIERAIYFHHHRFQHQDPAYIDEDEDISYEIAMTQLSIPRAGASRQMQTLYQLHQLKRNLFKEEEESSSSSARQYVKMPPLGETSPSLATTEQSTIDGHNTEDIMSGFHRNSQSYDEVMNPNGSVNLGIFPEDDGSCSSFTGSDGSSIITSTETSMTEWTLEIQTHCDTPTLVHSERLHGQPQPHHSVPRRVSISECFAGRMFHSVDDPENDEISYNYI